MYICTPFISATEWRTGRWQLAFDNRAFMFSLELLPGPWHRHDCLVEKQSAVEFGLRLTLDLSQWASR